MRRLSLIALASLLTAAPAFAQTQNSVKLFSKTVVEGNWQVPVTSPDQAVTFNTAQVQLQCGADRSAVLSSSPTDPTQGIVVDNLIKVNGKIAPCPNPYDNATCWSGLVGGEYLNNAVLGQSLSSLYYSDPALDISSSLTPGGQVVTVELADYGQVHGNSDLYLHTSCTTISGPLCHKPGTPAQQTLTVSQNAFKGHLGHGDYPGACQESGQQ
jgi:hypothetical protein